MNNKALLLLCGIMSGCHLEHPDSWESAGGGQCQDIAVFFEQHESPQCPHQEQGRPVAYAKNNNTVGYFCYCLGAYDE